MNLSILSSIGNEHKMFWNTMSRSLIGHIFEIWVSKKTDKPIKPKKPEKKLTEKTESRKKTDQTD